MVITFEDTPYEVLSGRDAAADGTYLEMHDVSSGTPEPVLSAHHAEGTGRITFSAHRADMPLEAVERFVQQARVRLPPAENPGTSPLRSAP